MVLKVLGLLLCCVTVESWSDNPAYWQSFWHVALHLHEVSCRYQRSSLSVAAAATKALPSSRCTFATSSSGLIATSRSLAKVGFVSTPSIKVLGAPLHFQAIVFPLSFRSVGCSSLDSALTSALYLYVTGAQPHPGDQSTSHKGQPGPEDIQ